MNYSRRVPLSMGGARPSLRTLSDLGIFRKVLPRGLAEGDIVAYGKSVYCVVKKASQIYRGSYITIRELVTHSVRQVRIEPHVWLQRLEAHETFSGPFSNGRWARWKPSVGDVVLYPGVFEGMSILAIRHSTGWFRTEAPWSPMQDIEIAHDLIERTAVMVRSHLRHEVLSPETEFTVGMVVAQGPDRTDPSVWFRKSVDHWVTISRGVAFSDQMIRYELGRRTYEVLRIPEDT